MAAMLTAGECVSGFEGKDARSDWSPRIGPGPAQAWVSVADGQAVPVVARTDVLVVESSLEGCFLAQRLAKLGRSVIVASTGTSLPSEIAMGLRPWLRRADLAKAPADVRSYIEQCLARQSGKGSAGEEVALDMIRVTERLEDRLLDAGVRLFYDMQPCGVKMTGRQIAAVIFACKGGLVAIEAATVVDCTPDARAAALAGARLDQRESSRRGLSLRYSMLCRKPPARPALEARGVGELEGGEVVMHGDFAEFRVRAPLATCLFRESAFGLEARRVAARTGQAIRQSGVWKDAAFVRGGDIVLADPMRHIVSRSVDRKLSIDACRPRELDNLLVCSPAADVADAVATTLVEPLAGPSLADMLEQAPWPAWAARPEEAGQVRLAGASGDAGRPLAAQARFEELRPVYSTEADIPIAGVLLPVVASCDVVVVGGGTSGAPAATVAAGKGLRTIVVEKFGDVGGTHTIGGVCKYWFGRQTEFVRRLDHDAQAAMELSGMPKCMGQLHTLMAAGADVVTHCMAVGTVLDGRMVTGVVVVTPDGLGVIQARRVVDATGDGDVVARAGVSMDYGVRRDAMTLWYSFAQFRGTNPEAARHFDCVVDVRDPADMSRAIISSRRRGAGHVAGSFPQYYLTPRESRHIRGLCTVTYEDILAGRRHEDVALICESNFDIKGIADSDLVFCGYAEPAYLKNYSVQIPFRALLPKDLDNILVIGKAYSVTHDALALARMQRDMMAMGGVAALAAAQSLREEKPLPAIDVRILQRELVELGVLSEEDLRSVHGISRDQLPALGDAKLREMVDQLAAGTLELDGTVMILARPESSIPVLKAAFAKADAKGRLPLAKALCFLGDTSGAGTLLAELDRQVTAASLPGVQSRHSLPDHGISPQPAQLIHLLGRLGDARVIPRLTAVAKAVTLNTAKSDSMFEFVFSVCCAAERLGNTACTEPLTILADKPGIRDGSLPRASDPRKTINPTADRHAYLELCVGRALARGGSRRGYEILLRYLGDIRAFLARSAHDELADLAGRDLGYDAETWQRWLAGATISPQPYRGHGPAVSR